MEDLSLDSVLLRSAAIRIAFVVALVLSLVVLSSRRAHAEPRVQSPVAHVMGGLYTPARNDEQLVWNARWVLSVEDAEAVSHGGSRTIRFASPLPEGETLDATSGIEAIVENDHLAGVRADWRALEGRSVRATLRQPLAKAASTGIPLGAPFAAGTAAQIVDGDLGKGARLEVTGARGIEKHVGFTGPAEIGHAARDEARRLTGYEPRLTGAPLYVRGEDIAARGVLKADVTSASERESRGGIAVGAGFVVVVGALILAMKKLGSRASVERADALLAAEIERG